MFKSVIAGLICSIFVSAHNPFPEEIGVKRVVIDAGHGGKDPGAIGIDGIREKDLALHVSLALGDMIKKNHEDVEVLYTRDTDVFVQLFERARVANNNNADLFISIHANASTNASAYGTETFALGLHRSEANLEVAKKENSVILMEDNYEVHYEGFDPNSDESYIALTLRQSAFLEQSLSLASYTQEQFKTLGRRDRGVKQAGFLVLYKTTMPSVLVEMGFVTHPKEGKYLADNANLNKIATGIYNAFQSYKAQVERKTAMFESSDGEKPAKNEVVLAESNEDLSLFYAVQLASSVERIDLPSESFKGIEGVYEIELDGVYKYTVGKLADLSKAVDLQGKVRENGFKDAFVIAVHNGKRIPISKALELNK